MNSHPPELVLVGSNATRLWGLSVDERARRMADKLGIHVSQDVHGVDPALLVSRDFVFDPVWLKELAGRPGQVLTKDGRAVIAHCRDAAERRLVAEAMQGGERSRTDTGMTLVAHEQADAKVNDELRKREQPFLLRLEPGTVRAAERASYFGAYKGVADLLTKYLWPEWALVLTRLAAGLGVSPNVVSLIGTLLCVIATILFWLGQYWAGMAAGLGFMVLDTVDGKLARVTVTASKLGELLDHGVDLIHPPFWWWAWAVGLSAYGLPIDPQTQWAVLAVIIIGYVVQRMIEGAFIALFGMHIHVWRKLDSRFRLITARRNPNMVILFASMLVGRPDLGLIAVAWCTGLSCLFHLVRLFQAMLVRARRTAIQSWLG